MAAADQIRKELGVLLEKQSDFVKLLSAKDKVIEFGTEYQRWYTRAIKIVQALASDRLDEFIGYYRIDPKRKSLNALTYTIQDYVQGIGPAEDPYTGKVPFDSHDAASIRVVNQIQILASLSSRIDSVLSDVTGRLFAELQDEELKAAVTLKHVSLRAAGALAGVVLERHLQRVAQNRNIPIKRKEPTIADLNDPLKAADAYDLPTWRKIQHLADLRNLCSHQKSINPTEEQVGELIDGVNAVVKNTY